MHISIRSLLPTASICFMRATTELAAATWATTQYRTWTLEWLRRGAALSGSGRVDMVGCKEFVAVSNDAEFLAASGGGELDKTV